MNLQALVVLAEPEDRQAVLENDPDLVPGAWAAHPACVADCPDCIYYKCPERMERERQASLEFLHRLVMGPSDV